jgi:4-diphosphocytidyl-2C-methyl-D-erythritol kinase
VWPGFPISTAEVYQSGAIDLAEPRRPAPVEKTPEGIKLVAAPPSFVFNRLEAAALAVSPELSEAMERMGDVVSPKSVHLSGSGSSLFTVVEDREAALLLRTRLRLAFPKPAVVERALAMA